MSVERWLPVIGYEGIYEVSDQGRVKSHLRNGRIRKPIRATSGHLNVDLWKNGKGRMVSIHRLVLFAFVGPPPTGMQCCHNDGDPTNNHLSNLRWDTQSANAQDALRHGAHPSCRVTHCPAGHEYTPENTRYYEPRHRSCLECRRIWGRNRKRSRRKVASRT